MLIFLIFFILGHYVWFFANLFDGMELRFSDVHFNLRRSLTQEAVNENIYARQQSDKLSSDIVIVGIEEKSLKAFGRWPFARSRHADLLNALTRIRNQSERERAVLLDILFFENAEPASDDLSLAQAIRENGRVTVEPMLYNTPENAEGVEELLRIYGEIRDISGDTDRVAAFYGLRPPLIPFMQSAKAAGHPVFLPDRDQVHRRQQLVSRYSTKVSEFPLSSIGTAVENTDWESLGRGHLAWLNRKGGYERAGLPGDTPSAAAINSLKEKIRKTGVTRVRPDGSEDCYVGIYTDHYIPSVTLMLALEYYHKSLDDVSVVLGSHIAIHNPETWDKSSGRWRAAASASGGDIVIPIDSNGSMLINYMGPRSSLERGGRQTYPVRPYVTYAQPAPDLSSPESWPETLALNGKLVLVGAFAPAMADDEKLTPLGLMYGVEMIANSLNTILMDNYIRPAAPWVNSLLMFCAVMLFAFMASRMKRTGWSALVLLVFIAASFFAVTFIFDFFNLLIDWPVPVMAVVLSYISAVLYRILFVEKDRRVIKSVFGQFISPAIVEELSAAGRPPRLGGENVNITVFFSDIRGFSSLSERLSDPQDLVSLLNEYLNDMTNNIVIDYQGTLDKYIGDAIMAFWGAPKAQEDHAVRACKSALKQIELLEALNQRLKQRAGDGPFEKLDIGIGINSGDCMVGYMGSEGRKNYTAMGDAVNLASRLEGVNKQYSTRILISSSTKKMIEHEPFVLRELDDIRVKGRRAPETIYELLDYEGSLD